MEHSSVIGDPWPEEPDEPLVEKYRSDEGDIGPGPPEPPEPPEPEEIPPDLQRTFWTIVGGLNVALLASSLGAMLIGFRGQWVVGGSLLGVGVAALIWSAYRYRGFRNRDRNE